MRRWFVVPLIACCLIMAACQPIEMTARDAVASAKGYLDSAKSHHPECSDAGRPGSANCQIITRGVAAKDSVIDALTVYCANAAFDTQGGVCHPAGGDTEAKLRSALKNLNQIMADVKKVAQ